MASTAGVAVAGAVAGGISPGIIGPILPKLTKLEMRIHKVRCVDETGGFFERFGNDEIDLGGIGVDETGDTHAIAKFRAGSNFDDGEQVNFSPPRSFTTFDLRKGTAFPKSYFVTLVLAESDPGGGLPTFVNQLVQKVKDKVRTAIIAAVGTLGASGGPIGVAIGLAVGAVLDRVFALLARIWADDIFPAVTASVSIASLTARWPGGKTDSPESIATFKGHGGHYQVTYDWRMFA